MTKPQFSTIEVGDILPALTFPPINRTTLFLFGGASGDYNPIHIDIDFARKSGMPDVFAHGMLGMAYLGRLLTQWVDQRQIRSFSVRFSGITHLGNQITCTGRVVKKYEVDGKNFVELELNSANQYGEIKILGDAVLAI